MNNLDKLLNQLGDVARKEPAPDVDVRQRVLQTIAVQQPAPKLDIVPIVFSGVAVTVAATIFIACFPSWQTMFDPWASYFAQVSQR
ncbi:MAG: hypothetical protein NXI28_21915 [bacterium]|nr:hypothetical protein [bacterium]